MTAFSTDLGEKLIHAFRARMEQRQKDDFEKSVRSLLDAGADPNFASPTGDTPLLLAAFSDLAAVADMLIRYGADIDKPSATGETPLMISLRGLNSVETAKVLLAHGANHAVLADKKFLENLPEFKRSCAYDLWKQTERQKRGDYFSNGLPLKNPQSAMPKIKVLKRGQKGPAL